MNIDALLERVDMMDLAEKAGAHFGHRGEKDARSRCPIHGGDNPTSFSVYKNGSGDIHHWRCYTRCDSGGDAIDFMKRWRGLDFVEAVRELASMYHVSLADIGWGQPADLEAEKKRRKRQDVLTAAADCFAARLWSPEGQAARGYLTRRGFTAETIEALGWGYTESDNWLSAYLQMVGADLDAAKDTGLIRADGRDFSANAHGRQAGPHGWIVFPHRVGERVTYYSARAVEIEGQPRPDPDDKSRNLPGARQMYRCEAPGAYEQVTIVEGPLDAASLYQLGQSAWALCGLGSLPEEEVARLKKRGAVYLATDGDEGGQSAISKPDGMLIKAVNAMGPLTMILAPSDGGKDFNAALQAGELTPDGFNQLKCEAKTWLETRIVQAAECPDAESESRMLEIGALLAAVPEATQSKYYRLAQRILGLSRKDIQNLIRQAAQSASANILASIKDGQLCFANQPLLNGKIEITHELVMDDGQDMPTVRFTISGRLVNGQPLEPLDIEADEFDQFRWMARHWGRGPILYIPKSRYWELNRAIMEISSDAKRERVYTYTGWTKIDGQPAYLSSSGAIHAQGHNSNVRVELGVNNLRHFALPAPPSGDDLYTSVQASLDFLDIGPRHVTAPLWAAMFAAPLTEISPLYAVLWVYGQTQSGKSTIVHLALTHYGAGFVQGRQYHAPIDWTSTATSLEGAMFTSKDAPLVIDDFAPQFASAADSRDMHRKAHYVIRSVGNRSSRGRARADLTARKERVPRGLVISTAENPLMGQSIVGRMIYVPIARGELLPMDGKTNPRLDAAQDAGQRGFYAQAMAAYLQWLSTNYDRVARELPERINALAKKARSGNPNMQSRLPDYYALLTAAQETALNAFAELGMLTEYDVARQSQENSDAIFMVVAQQAERIATESPVRKVLEALGALLARKKVYLDPRTNDVKYVPPAIAELVGWFGTKQGEEDWVFLDTRQCLIEAKQYWNGLGENLDILPDAFLLQTRQITGLIAKLGELNKDNGKERDEASVYCAGKPRRVLVLDRRRIMNLYGVDISNESAIPAPEPEE